MITSSSPDARLTPEQIEERLARQLKETYNRATYKNKDFSVTFSGKEFICVDKGFEKDEKVEVVIRPEDVEIVDEFSGQLKGKVESIIFKGVHYEMMVNTGDFIYKVHSTLKREVSDNVGIKIIPDNIHIMRKKI